MTPGTSRIFIQFNSNPNPGDRIFMSSGSSMVPETVSYDFVNQRSFGDQCTIGADISETIQNLLTAFSVDYNFYDFLNASSVNSNTILVQNNKDKFFFDTAFVEGDWGEITDIINNDPFVNLEVIDSFFSEDDSDPCNRIKMTITTTKQADVIEFEGFNINPTSNVFSIFFDRNKRSFFIIKQGFEQIRFDFIAPVTFFLTNVENRFTPQGYTSTIKISSNSTIEQSFLNSLEYSINGTDYQNSSSFPGLLPGNYTAYVRDPYGCQKTLNFTIDDDESSSIKPDPFVEVSELNSIRMVRQDDKLKNPNNTLSFQEKGLNFKDWSYKALPTDIITQQFRSNYNDHRCVIIDSDGNEEVVTITKESNNINLFDQRDARIAYYPDNSPGAFAAVYMDGGLIYNTETGETQNNNLFGTLPSFYEVGTFIRIGNLGWYSIDSIEYSEELEVWLAVTNYIPEGSNDLGVIRATVNYNQLNYDVYQCDVDFSDKEGCYQLCLEAINDNETINYNSELIKVQSDFENLHEIRYWNSDNNEINYSTGIRHLVRLPFIENDKDVPSVEVNQYRSDDRFIHEKGVVTDLVEFRLNGIPRSIQRQIARAVSLDNLLINGVPYILNEFSSEPLGNRNLYDITLTVAPSQNQFESDSGVRVITNLTSGGFISVSQGGGFIKHNN